jgi:hypothetical protein
VDVLKHREGGMVFYQVFLRSLLQCTLYNNYTVEISKRLREFEEKTEMQSCRGDCE